MADKQQHRDKEGKGVGGSEERTDWTGDSYTQHIDSEGRNAGSSEEATNLFGDKFIRHLDRDNNSTGFSEKKTDWTGSEYVQHYDDQGRRAGQSERTSDAFGGERIVHRDRHGNIVGESTGENIYKAGNPPSRVPARTSVIRSILPKSSDDEGWNGIGFLLALIAALTVIFLAVYFGLPILGGFWLAKTVNKKWINPVQDRHRMRWLMLPAVFASTAILLNELIATGFMAANCSDPQSLSCSGYLRRPAPTLFGLHLRFLPQSLASKSDQQNILNPSNNYQPGANSNAFTANTGSTPVQSGVSYGAISRSTSTGKLGLSWNFSSQASAEARASQECGMNDCTNILWFRNGYGAFAQADDGAWGAHWGATRQEAEQKALSKCQQTSQTANSCRIRNLVSSRDGVNQHLSNFQKTQESFPWQASCGSPPVSGVNWLPVIGPRESVETVRSRYCGDAYSKADGTVQVASFSSFEEATAFAKRLSQASGYSFTVGQPKAR
ncbi:MAG: DUF4189 domain-containing protein [Synechococcus sp.]|nr:DUF4189 domain-containing protein [Synechococcus sp.]